jgi:hypothetical protein
MMRCRSGFGIRSSRLELDSTLRQDWKTKRFKSNAFVTGWRSKEPVINALVGEDLAAVGLRETTAVINVIRYGDDQPDDVFDVHWSDGRIEPFGRDRLDLWQGDSLNAERTAHIEFRRPVPFLRDLAIIDTPGTGSTIARHEQVLKSCIERAEDLTRQECTKADAVLYVMPSVAKQRDQDLLQDVQMNSRGTALSPFNCFGVIHMWEGYASSSDDPWEAAVAMAAKNYQELGELVSGVIPVSAPLATAARIATDGQLESLARLAMDPSDKDFKTMVLGEAMFGRPFTPSPLSIEERKNLQKSLRLPWPCLATVLRLLRKSKPGSAVEVRQLICGWGGRDRLMNELERRFFSRVEMVRSATLLQSFTTSCRQAERVLRKNLRAVVLQQIELGENITRTRRESMVGEIIYDPANDVLKQQRDELEGREGLLRSNLWLAGNGAASLEEDFRELDLDLRALNALSQDSGTGADDPGVDHQLLRGLFGHYGAAPQERLARFLGDSEVAPEIELPQRILMFRRMAHTTSQAKTRWLLARAVERMEDLFNWWLAHADERAHINDTNSSKGGSP